MVRAVGHWSNTTSLRALGGMSTRVDEESAPKSYQRNFGVLQNWRCKVNTLVTASPELKRLWIRVLKRVHPDLAVSEQDTRRCERLAQQANDTYTKSDEALLRAIPAPKGPLPDPWKAWAEAQQATPLQSTNQPPLAPRQPRAVSGPEAFGILWAACAVLCLLLYGIFAALREIVGRTTCFSFLLLLTGAVLWLIAKNSKLSYNHKAKWVAAVASAMILIGICLLNTSRATPLFLSARAATAQAMAAPVALKDSDPLDFMKAHAPQNKTPPREATVTPTRAAAQLGGYIEAVKNNVSQKWNLSEVAASTPAGATVYIQFAVRRRGNHEVPTVETSSGYSSLDASCLRAVNRAQDFSHFPKSYTGDSLTVLYHCTYPGSPTIGFAQDSTLLPVQPPPSHIPVDGVPGVQQPTNDTVVIR
jgi:TonB C terminal